MITPLSQHAMTAPAVDLTGMPYVPGFATGVLRRPSRATDGGILLLLDPDDLRATDRRPDGVIVVDGAPFSHAMIGLLGLGVPTVLITARQAQSLTEGMPLWLDAVSGRIRDVSASATEHADVPTDPQAGECVRMADGTPVSLRASVRDARAARRAVKHGAAAIGLVRSEFLLPDVETPPDAAAYRSSFTEICAVARPLPVTVRLLDLAVDKLPAWLPAGFDPGGMLGLQGVRLYHTAPVRDVIDAQLSALASLDEAPRLRLLLPYLVRLEELDYWLDHLHGRVPATLPIGAMVETPAAMLDAAHWLQHAAFLAIGCNDLMQCLFAADRDRPALRHYLDAYAPLLFRLFRQLAESAPRQVGDIQLCGVLSQLPGVLPILLGLGYRTFSVDAGCIPYMARTVAGCRQDDVMALAADVCAAQRTQEVLEMLALPTDRHVPYLA